ncbi:MAG: sugar phosphate nucleotidyltransferase [Planctomycetota bacterium]|nr:sugar phosphate nucleotidyltransferase [Planctomycetota bacterium]
MAETSHRYAMIMAGGVGTRLWPMSRKDKPKQLLPMVGGKSLLQLAAERLEGVVPPERRYVCALEEYRDIIRDSLPQFGDAQILGEPVGRDTLNAIGLTAIALSKKDPEAIFAVLSSDHIIEPLDEFQRKLDLGLSLVEDDPSRFVTFSIQPTEPSTAYGYVERGEAIPDTHGAYHAKRFVEKPDLPTAKQYVAAGNFGWNSGLFVFAASTFIDALKRFKPRAYEGLMEIADAWGTEQQAQVMARIYPRLPKISVDYAVMEPACRDEAISVCTVTMGIWWMDIGSWPSFGETLPHDGHENASNTKTLHLDSRNILTVSDDPEHTIATLGCDDLIIVHTKNVTMVCPRDQDQRVKELAAKADESLQ